MKAGSLSCGGGKREPLSHDPVVYGMMYITGRTDPVDDLMMPTALFPTPVYLKPERVTCAGPIQQFCQAKQMNETVVISDIFLK